MPRVVGWFIAAAVVWIVCAEPSDARSDDRAEIQGILDRAVEAMGGREALEAIEHATYDVFGEGDSRDFTYHMRGENDRIYIAWSPFHDGHAGRVGDLCWTSNVSEHGLFADVTDCDHLFQMFNLAFHRQVLDLLPLVENAEITGRHTEGDATYVGVTFRCDDDTALLVLFSEQTALPQWLHVKLRGHEFAYVFSEWKQINEIVLFTKVEMPSLPGDAMQVRASFAPLADEMFDPPPAVQSLLATMEAREQYQQRIAAIAEMDVETVVQELSQVAKERMDAHGTPRGRVLRREFRVLMDRLRELRAEEAAVRAGQSNEGPFTYEQTQAMTLEEVMAALTSVSKQRHHAGQTGDMESAARLRQEFEWLMERRRSLR